MSKDGYIHLVGGEGVSGEVVFTFHGTGGNEQQFHGFAEHALPQARIVSPRGDVSEHGAARFFRRKAEGVYDMDDLARATAKMRAFVAAQAEGASKVTGIGYSNGANILASVVFSKPELFNRAVLMHPLIPFEPELAGEMDGLSVLITAGRRDPICPPGQTENLIELFRSRQAEVLTAWHDGGHEIQQAEVEAIARFLS